MGGTENFDERIRFKVPGFDGAKEVYRFDDPIPAPDEILNTEPSAEEIQKGAEAVLSGEEERSQTAPFDQILTDIDEETGAEKYAGIFEEEVSQEEIDALVREELAKRGLLRVHVFPEEEEDDEEETDIYQGDLVSDNDPLIAKLEEEAKKLREEEQSRETRALTWKEQRELKAAEKKAEAERRAAEKAAAKAAEKRGAESQIEAERRMIAEHREAEAMARRVVEKRLARQKKKAIKAEKMRTRGRGPLAVLAKLLMFLLICAFALTLGVITMRMLGKSEMVNTRVTGTVLSLPEGIDGMVTSDRTIIYNGNDYQYNSARSNILVMGINPKAEEGKTLDSALLFSIDTASGKTTLISIPGETICEVDAYTGGGSYEGLVTTTLNKAFSLGGSGKLGAVNAAEAVSRLLYGIPINAYLSLDLRSMENLADAVGGVDVIATREFAERYREFKAGETIILTGDLAEKYTSSLKYDDKNEFAKAEEDADRMERQKLFMLGFLKNAVRDTKNNLLFPVHLSQFLKPYTSSNLSLTRKLYILSVLLRDGYDEESAFAVPGNAEMRSGEIRWRVKPKKLCAQVVKTFFKKM